MLTRVACVLGGALAIRPVGATTATPTLAPTPTLVGALGRRTLGGVVYNLAIDKDIPVPGAMVTYVQTSALGGVRGTTFSSDDGRYQFEIELYDTDSITVAVEAQGFNAAGLRVEDLYAHQNATRLDIGLEPATRSAAPPACVGDCSRRGAVTVVDLIRLINLSLGAAVEICDPGDVDGDRAITVDEVTAAVGNALDGCALEPPDFSVVEVRIDAPQDCHSPTMHVCLTNDGGATDRIVDVDVERRDGFRAQSAESFDVRGIGAGEVRCFERPFQSFGTIRVDPADRIQELDEGNNVVALAGSQLECLPTRSASPSPTPTGSFVPPTPTATVPTATPTTPPAPNLIVYSVTADSSVTTTSCIFDVPSYPRLRLCIRNAGNQRSGPFSISLDGEAVLRAEDVRAGNFFCRSVPFVAAGTVVADSAGEVAESDEHDNSAEFSVVRPTPPATCTPVRTPTGTPTGGRATCCQDQSGCYAPDLSPICLRGVAYESPAFCNSQTGQCENFPPTRTPTPTRNPTQPAADLVPVSAELYAPLLKGCGRDNPVGGRYCIANRGGDVSTSFVLRFVDDDEARDFASFAGIRGGEQLCVIGLHQGSAELVVDPYDSVAESDESNNSLRFSMPRPTYPPDCTPTPTPQATPTF